MCLLLFAYFKMPLRSIDASLYCYCTRLLVLMSALSIQCIFLGLNVLSIDQRQHVLHSYSIFKMFEHVLTVDAQEGNCTSGLWEFLKEKRFAVERNLIKGFFCLITRQRTVPLSIMVISARAAEQIEAHLLFVCGKVKLCGDKVSLIFLCRVYMRTLRLHTNTVYWVKNSM